MFYELLQEIPPIMVLNKQIYNDLNVEEVISYIHLRMVIFLQSIIFISNQFQVLSQLELYKHYLKNSLLK